MTAPRVGLLVPRTRRGGVVGISANAHVIIEAVPVVPRWRLVGRGPVVPWVVGGSRSRVVGEAVRLSRTQVAMMASDVADVGWSLAGHLSIGGGGWRGPWTLLAGLEELAGDQLGGLASLGARRLRRVSVSSRPRFLMAGMGIELLDTAPVPAQQTDACR